MKYNRKIKGVIMAGAFVLSVLVRLTLKKKKGLAFMAQLYYIH
jgi:hypothetical protein